ncbi:MAG: LysR family transcriptional regulator [Myxococcota bacterium]|nr:LysR family transcriptional regulator [Myxococcota bacterium]
MDIRDLEEFLAVLEHGSILGAAETRGVAQPALSRRMRALEEALGVPLLTRSSQGVTATVYGSLLERHARLVLRDRQQALDELQSLRDGVQGHARVGVAPALSGLLPGAIERLSKDRSGLTFTVLEGTYDALVRDLRAGEIDGAFTLLVPGEGHEGLSVHRLVEDPVRIFCNPEHRLRRKRKLRFENLGEERWALISRPRSIIEMFRSIAVSRGIESPRVSVETDSLDLLKSLVLHESFLTALPQGAMRAELGRGQVATLAIEGLPVLAAGFLHRQEVLPPAVSLLLEEVSTSARL